MADKKQDSSFKVTDRRLFTSDGELRSDVAEEVETPKPEPTTAATEAAAKPPAPTDGAATEREMPVPPTKAEQDAQAAAYRQSSKDLDSEVELSGHSAKEFEITFERFMAQLYMTAIDTLSLISEKTKGNLTAAEENFLQNSLYELRMAYVEVTNALARPPQPGPATGTTGR
jgi:hypothetical protein